MLEKYITATCTNTDYPLTWLLLTTPKQTAQLMTTVCTHDRRALYQLALNVHVKRN